MTLNGRQLDRMLSRKRSKDWNDIEWTTKGQNVTYRITINGRQQDRMQLNED